MLILSELLRINQVELQLRSGGKVEVLRELIALIPEFQSSASEQESFLQALLAREQLHTTAVGNGIAFPHARQTSSTSLKRAVLVFGRHPQGVPFGAPDNDPVQLFFLIASPHLADHLAMLAGLSRLMRDQHLRSELLACSARDDVPRLLREAELRARK